MKCSLRKGKTPLGVFGRDDKVRIYVIRIWKDYPKLRKFLRCFVNTISHEITHKLIWEEGIAQPASDYQGEETICEKMETYTPKNL